MKLDMIQNIDPKKIQPHPDNPRKNLGDLTELVDSIRINGVLENLVVVPLNPPVDGMDFRCVIGHRRRAAAIEAGLDEVRCIVMKDMSPIEQIRMTMIENINRNDLTIPEQAQGFQLMMNLGDTVADISEKTGFSETKVRRRVKLMEYDGEKVQGAFDRGARLEDFEELKHIKDPALRNTVLDAIGTSNFRYELKEAKDKEAAEMRKATLVEKLEEFATRVESEDGFIRVAWYQTTSSIKFSPPEDADTEEYFYAFPYNGCGVLLKRQTETEVEAESETAAVHQEKRDELEERRTRLEEITRRVYRLRYEFVKNFAVKKKHIRDIMEFAVKTLICEYLDLDDFMMAAMLGIDLPEAHQSQVLSFEMLSRAAVSTEKLLLVTAYCCCGDSPHWGNYSTYDCIYDPDEDLDDLHGFLCKLGYEMSDEEKALQDGTHELYVKPQEETDKPA